MRLSHFIVCLTLVVLILPLHAALGQGLSIKVETEGAPQPWLTSPNGVLGPGGAYHYQGSWTNAQGLWQCDWDITAKADPWVSANITFLNSTANPQIYTVTITQPIMPPITPTTLIGGSMGGSVTDANFSGTGILSTVSPTPLYQAFLDNTPVLPIYPHPTSYTFAFAGQTVSIPAVNVGLPGPSIPSGPVLSTISIQHRFLLSAGDSMALTSFFVVTPEPATLALLALGGLTVMRRRR